MGLLGNFDFLPEDQQQREAARAGLMQFGASLLGGTGNFGQILGQGIQQGAQGYHGTLAQQQQKALRDLQAKQLGLENQKLQAGIDEPMELAKIASGAGGGPRPLGAPPAAGGIAPVSSLPQVGQVKAAPAPAPAEAKPVDQYQYYMGLAQAYSGAGKTTAAKAAFDIADKLKPRLKEQQARTVDGKRVLANVYEDGRTEQVQGFAPDLEKLHFSNIGGSTAGQDVFSGEVKSTVKNTVSPGDVLSAETQRRGQDITMRGQNLTDARAAKGTAPAGYRWAAGGELEPIPGGPVTAKTTDQQQRMNDATSVVDLLGEAMPLLDTSTNSYGGAAYDQAARVFGKSTAGAQSAAQLKVIGGQLIAKQPKMTGPQSDKDVQLYREMAGQIGDPTLPAETRKAAANVILKLNQKYISDNTKPAGVPARKDLPQNPPAGPKPGAVQNGFRFKGGNPSDKSNWEKA